MSNCQEMPPLMILGGGRGTRLRDVTELLPKPMVPIGPQPIVWHIMKCYAAFGVRRFILCLGYKREEFVHYFLNFRALTSDITLHPGTPGDIRYTGNCPESEWEITLADTGLDSCTATRIRLAARHLHPTDSCFFLTYGDAVADIDIRAVLKRHRAGGQLLTVSAVHPEGRFGEMRFDGDRVCGFTEKPARTEGYINGGFMVMEKSFIERMIPADRDVFLEAEPMRAAVAADELNAYRHEGFWQCMDTPREYTLLNDMWKNHCAPWTRFWPDAQPEAVS